VSSAAVVVRVCPRVRLLESAINEDLCVSIRAVEVSNLYFLFTEEADKHVDEDRHNVEPETGPVVNPECCH
jgi:hypothetical protein